MILSIEGERKEGKSTLAHTAPLPIVSFDFDMGTDGAVQGTKWELFKDASIRYLLWGKVTEDEGKQIIRDIKPNEILVFEVPKPLQTNPIQLRGVLEQWNYCTNLLAEAERTDSVVSIVVDTMTEARDRAVDAFLQQEQITRNRVIANWSGPGSVPEPRVRLQQLEYGQPHGWIRDWYSTVQGSRKNLVATHHLTDGYKPDPQGGRNRVPSGERVLHGMPRTYESIDAALRLRRGRIQNMLTQDWESAIIGKFLWCRFNLALEGQEVINPTWDLIAQFIMNSVQGRIQLPLRSSEV